MTSGGATAIPVTNRYDIFLSYNRADFEGAESARRYLAERGLRPFMDYTALVPGLPWPEALEQALTGVRAVAVFIGPSGFGGWQQREVYLALDLQVREQKQNRQLLVVPVLLPGADLSACFLFLNTWVDLRADPQGGLQSLADAVAGVNRPVPPVDPASVVPYIGLRAFREEHSAFFFGRDTASDALVERVSKHRVVAVIGSSGSGKSSVVLAGLVPRLRRQRRPQPVWEICSFTPGRHPWRRLADALAPLVEPGAPLATCMEHASTLARDLAQGNGAFESVVEQVLRASKGSTRLLVVIDQLEELFTLTPADERQAVLKTLFDAAEDCPVSIVCTLRADYVATALDFDARFTTIFSQANVHLGQLTRSELELVVEGPLRALGAKIEPGLRDALLDDVLGSPAQLPLLAYSLEDLWQRCASGKSDVREVTLTHAAYSNRLESAIGRRAEDLFESLGAEAHEDTRRLFRSLVRVADGGQTGGDTRRRARRSEIGEAGWAIALRFASPEYRLVVIASSEAEGHATAEVAHEAIIENWARLKQWVNEDRARLVVEQRVRDAQERWEEQGRHEDYLLEGALLVSALELPTLPDAAIARARLEFLLRSLVLSSGALAPTVKRYATLTSVVPLAQEYLAAPDETHRKGGLELLRWSPEAAASEPILRVCLQDPEVKVRRCAVRVLFARGEGEALRALLGPASPDRLRALEAIAHARNIRGVGLSAVKGLPTQQAAHVAVLSIWDLLIQYRGEIALIFAVTSIATHFGLSITHTILRTLSRVMFRLLTIPRGVDLYTFSSGAIEFTAACGTLALLRAIIDERALSRAQLFRAGVAAGFLYESMVFAGRLLEEAITSAFGGPALVNLALAFTDRLPTLLAMGIFLGAGPQLVVPKPQTRRLWPVALAVAAVSACSKLIPVAVLGVVSSDVGAVIDELVATTTLNSAAGSILGFVVALIGLHTLRFALRVAFDGQPFPQWPVPSIAPRRTERD